MTYKKQLITHTFDDDDRTFVLYGQAPNRTTAKQVKAACEAQGTDVYLTRGAKHYYIWVELKWMQYTTKDITFVPATEAYLYFI